MTLAGLGWLPWRGAVVATVVLLVLMGLLALSPRTRRGMRVAGEAALILALYAVWQVVAANTTGGVEGAADAGLWIARLQDALAFPSEAWLQQMVIANESIIAVADWYYVALHIPMLVVTLLWVLFLHLRDWAFARTTIVLLTGMCLLVQFKPVAPPRLLPAARDHRHRAGARPIRVRRRRRRQPAVRHAVGAHRVGLGRGAHHHRDRAHALAVAGDRLSGPHALGGRGDRQPLHPRRRRVGAAARAAPSGIALCFPSQRPARLAWIRMPWEPEPPPVHEGEPDGLLPATPGSVR